MAQESRQNETKARGVFSLEDICLHIIANFTQPLGIVFILCIHRGRVQLTSVHSQINDKLPFTIA